MTEEHVVIDTSLVRRLIASQFPQWKELSIDPVATSGWDNRTFHLGKDKSDNQTQICTTMEITNDIKKMHDLKTMDYQEPLFQSLEEILLDDLDEKKYKTYFHKGLTRLEKGLWRSFVKKNIKI